MKPELQVGLKCDDQHKHYLETPLINYGDFCRIISGTMSKFLHIMLSLSAN
jgi:hypothetical protein